MEDLQIRSWISFFWHQFKSFRRVRQTYHASTTLIQASLNAPKDILLMVNQSSLLPFWYFLSSPSLNVANRLCQQLSYIFLKPYLKHVCRENVFPASDCRGKDLHFTCSSFRTFWHLWCLNGTVFNYLLCKTLLINQVLNCVGFW